MRKSILFITLAFVLCAVFVAFSPPCVKAQGNATYYGTADALYYWIYSAFDDSLLNYGVRPRLNAKTWFNTKGISTTDTLQSWRRSLGNTEAFVDSLGNFTLRGITMGANLTGTTTNTVSVARFISLMAGDPGTPQFTSNLDQDTGSYSLGYYGNRWGVSTGGVNRAIWDSTGTYLRGRLELRGNVVPNSDSLLVLRSSAGNTVSWEDSLGNAWFDGIVTADTLHIVNSVATGYGIVDGLFIARANQTLKGTATIDTINATNTVTTGYNITNGAIIGRAGETITGIAASDTIHTTNIVATGYGIFNGVGIFRSGTTTTGIATVDTLHSTNTVSTGYSITNGTIIGRAGETITGIAASDTVHTTNAVDTGYHITNGTIIGRSNATITGYVKADSILISTDTSLIRESTNKIATTDTLKAAAFQATDAVLWGPSLADFVAVATDSVVTAGAAVDTSMARTSWQQYFSWDSATSPSLKTGIYSQVFIPTGSLNPDSLLVNLWFDGTAAVADSGAIMIVVKDTAGTIISTGWVTVAVTSTWQHNAYVMATPLVKQQEYAMQIYMKSVSGGRWCWSCPRFK